MRLHTNWLQPPVVSRNRSELLQVLFPLHQVTGAFSSLEYSGEFLKSTSKNKRSLVGPDFCCYLQCVFGTNRNAPELAARTFFSSPTTKQQYKQGNECFNDRKKTKPWWFSVNFEMWHLEGAADLGSGSTGTQPPWAEPALPAFPGSAQAPKLPEKTNKKNFKKK